MAIYHLSDFGHLSGRIGEYVASSWLGRNVLRRYPTRMPNPRTPEQQANRSRFATAVALCKGLLPSIRLGFGLAGPERSAFNHALSANLPYILKVPGVPASITWASLTLSLGSLTAPTLQSATDQGAGILRVTWSHPLRPIGPSFLAMAAAVLTGGSEWQFAQAAAPESDLALDLFFHQTPLPGQVAHLYLFALDPTTGEASTTHYASFVY